MHDDTTGDESGVHTAAGPQAVAAWGADAAKYAHELQLGECYELRIASHPRSITKVTEQDRKYIYAREAGHKWRLNLGQYIVLTLISSPVSRTPTRPPVVATDDKQFCWYWRSSDAFDPANVFSSVQRLKLLDSMMGGGGHHAGGHAAAAGLAPQHKFAGLGHGGARGKHHGASSGSAACASTSAASILEVGGLRIAELQAVGAVSAFFPLHTREARGWLRKHWAKPWQGRGLLSWLSRPFEQPMGAVREYLGDAIAFYFEWLAFYTMWLVAPTVVGILIYR